MYVKVDMTARDGKGLKDDSLNWSDDPAYREVIAVSYTHLDVYQRQGILTLRTRAETLLAEAR